MLMMAETMVAASGYFSRAKAVMELGVVSS
jgi:hypothetical protein